MFQNLSELVLIAKKALSVDHENVLVKSLKQLISIYSSRTGNKTFQEKTKNFKACETVYLE